MALGKHHEEITERFLDNSRRYMADGNVVRNRLIDVQRRFGDDPEARDSITHAMRHLEAGEKIRYEILDILTNPEYQTIFDIIDNVGLKKELADCKQLLEQKVLECEHLMQEKNTITEDLTRQIESLKKENNNVFSKVMSLVNSAPHNRKKGKK